MVTEERVVNLEATLATFIEQTNRILAANHEDIAEIRASNARTDRQLLEMQQQAEKDRQRADKERQQAEKERKQSFERADKERQQAEKERKQSFERADNDRQQFEEKMNAYFKRWDKERAEFRKQLAEISDSMGTLIEDMVAPCGFQLAKAVFADEEAQTCAIRIKRKHPAIAGEMMELDLLAIGPTKLLVVEVKRRMDAAKAAEYRQKLSRMPEFFPELAGKKLYPAVASVYLEPSVVSFLNREKLYEIAMGEEVMEIVNLGQF